MALPKELGHYFHQACWYHAYGQHGTVNLFVDNSCSWSLLKSGIVSLIYALSLISTSVAIILSALSHKSDKSSIIAIYSAYVILVINTHNNKDCNQITVLSIAGRNSRPTTKLSC